MSILLDIAAHDIILSSSCAKFLALRPVTLVRQDTRDVLHYIANNSDLYIKRTEIDRQVRCITGFSETYWIELKPTARVAWKRKKSWFALRECSKRIVCPKNVSHIKVDLFHAQFVVVWYCIMLTLIPNLNLNSLLYLIRTWRCSNYLWVRASRDLPE